MKRSLILLFLVLAIPAASLAADTRATDARIWPPRQASAGQVDSWNIDNDLKFHFAFFIPEEPLAGAGFETVPVTRLSAVSQDHTPDISNIDLDAICGLGFPLPLAHPPGSFTFYLKFFAFPDSVSSCISAKRVIDGYALMGIPRYPELRSYLLRNEHLLVKKGFIAPSDRAFDRNHPFPPLLIPRSGQAYFDGHQPFVSLYLTPSTPEPAGLSDDERTAWSGRGVVAFHRDLLAAYRRTLEPVEGVDGAHYHYFRLPSPPEADTVTILKVPRMPMIFTDNWRNLPMPQDPQKVFLSALLLVFRTEYARTGERPAGSPRSPHQDGPSAGARPAEGIVVDSPAFQEITSLQRTQVLEVGSVVRIP